MIKFYHEKAAIEISWLLFINSFKSEYYYKIDIKDIILSKNN